MNSTETPTSPLTQILLPTVASILANLNYEPNFVMPNPENGRLTALLDKPGYSPPLAGTGMTLRRIEWQSGDCTPVHAHKRRSKLYDQTWGTIKILLWSRGVEEKPDEFLLGDEAPGEEHFFVIPPGCPHAVMEWGCDDFTGRCETFVFATPDDPADIIWEPSAVELCKNAHLKPS